MAVTVLSTHTVVLDYMCMLFVSLYTYIHVFVLVCADIVRQTVLGVRCSVHPL